MFYLVRMVPKQNLFSFCSCDDLLLLRFFVYQCFFKRKGYIIPKLEYLNFIFSFYTSEIDISKFKFLMYVLRKWIPGIGADLILANFEHHSPLLEEHKNPSDGSLLTLLGDQFDIFTRCGSLTPLQIFAIFQLFKQYPQYKQSCFHQQCNDFYATKTNEQDIPAIHSDEGKERDEKN